MAGSQGEEAQKLRRRILSRLKELDAAGLRRVLEIAEGIARAGAAGRALPQTAPELYADRPAGETVPAFVSRVYGAWLDGNFTRADLRKLDPRAEKALRDWEYHHGRVPESALNLPTLKERNDRLLAAGLESEPDALRRQGLRNIEANRRYRASRSSS
jgi:hypothetical protein